MRTIPFNASPHQIDWGKANSFKNHPVDILLSNEEKLDEKEEVKVMSKASNNLKLKINPSLKKENVNKKVLFDERSQEIGVSMFQASVSKMYSLKEEDENIINSGAFNPDSIFSSNINDTQNLSKKN